MKLCIYVCMYLSIATYLPVCLVINLLGMYATESVRGATTTQFEQFKVCLVLCLLISPLYS